MTFSSLSFMKSQTPGVCQKQGIRDENPKKKNFLLRNFCKNQTPGMFCPISGSNRLEPNLVRVLRIFCYLFVGQNELVNFCKPKKKCEEGWYFRLSDLRTSIIEWTNSREVLKSSLRHTGRKTTPESWSSLTNYTFFVYQRTEGDWRYFGSRDYSFVRGVTLRFPYPDGDPTILKRKGFIST